MFVGVQLGSRPRVILMAMSGAQNATDHARGHQKCRTLISAIRGITLFVCSDGPQLFTHLAQPIIDTHRNTLSRYNEATDGSTARYPLSLFANDA
jgi:hypothetical protein